MNTYGLAEILGYSGSLACFMNENWQQAIEIANRVKQLEAYIPAFNNALHSPVLANYEQAMTAMSRLADLPDTHHLNRLEQITSTLEQISHQPAVNRWEAVLSQIDSPSESLAQWTSETETDGGSVAATEKDIHVPSSVVSTLQSVEPFLPDNQREKTSEIASSLQENAFWTVDRVIALISLLLSLLSFICDQLPDHEVIQLIETSEEQVQEVRESKDRLDTILAVEESRLEIEKEQLDIAKNIVQSLGDLMEILQSEDDAEDCEGVQ